MQNAVPCAVPLTVIQFPLFEDIRTTAAVIRSFIQ